MTEIPVFSQKCFMDLDQAAILLEMLESHTEFAEVGVDIKYDVEEIGCLVRGSVPEDKVLIIIDSPQTINMPNFYGEFCKALNQKRETDKK